MSMDLGLVELIIFKSEDGATWDVVPPDEVPAKIKDSPHVIEYLEGGMVAQFPDETTLYMALKNGIGGSVPTDKIKLTEGI